MTLEEFIILQSALMMIAGLSSLFAVVVAVAQLRQNKLLRVRNKWLEDNFQEVSDALVVQEVGADMIEEVKLLPAHS